MVCEDKVYFVKLPCQRCHADPLGYQAKHQTRQIYRQVVRRKLIAERRHSRPQKWFAVPSVFVYKSYLDTMLL